MGDRGLKILGVLVVLFAALFFFSDREDRVTSAPRQKPLLADVPVEDVRFIEVKQGEKSVELAFENNSWVLPAKSGYRADIGKVRALLLSVLEMPVSQEITDNPEKHALLGVTDEEVTAGRAKVSLLNAEKKSIAQVFLGKMRRINSKDGAPTPTGQYVRRGISNQVYVIQQPVSVSVDLANWLDAGISSVLESQIASIDQSKLAAEEKLSVFKLERKDGRGDFEPTSGTAGEDEISLIRSGLENMRLADVLKADDPALAVLKFDSHTDYHLFNGLVYSVETAQQKDAGGAEQKYLKLSVSFDPQQVEKLAQLKADEAKSAAAEVKPSENAPAEESTPVVKPAVSTLPDAANEEDAKVLNARYQGWIYQVPDYLSAKFRQGL